MSFRMLVKLLPNFPELYCLVDNAFQLYGQFVIGLLHPLAIDRIAHNLNSASIEYSDTDCTMLNTVISYPGL